MILTGGQVILVYLIMVGAFGFAMIAFLIEGTYWKTSRRGLDVMSAIQYGN